MNKEQEIGLGKILIGAIVIGVVLVAGVVGARMIIAPSFTAANNDYRYQWHRVANEQEWKDFKIKYRGEAYCRDCHADQSEKVVESVHAKVQCESCHGPAIDHPDDPKKLNVDRGRGLCLRCHSSLPYRPANYAELSKGQMQLKMVKAEEHNPGVNCVDCHDAHRADFK